MNLSRWLFESLSVIFDKIFERPSIVSTLASWKTFQVWCLSSGRLFKSHAISFWSLRWCPCPCIVLWKARKSSYETTNIFSIQKVENHPGSQNLLGCLGNHPRCLQNHLGDPTNDDTPPGWVASLCRCPRTLKDPDYRPEKTLKRSGFCDNLNRSKLGTLYLHLARYAITSKMNHRLRDAILIAKFYVRDRFLILYSGRSSGLGHESPCELRRCCIAHFFANKCTETETWREPLMWNMVINSTAKLPIQNSVVLEQVHLWC